MSTGLSDLLDRLSLKQCMEYLISRFIQENATQLQYNLYPFAVQQMSVRYLGNHFLIRFNSSLTDKSRMELVDEHHAKIPMSAPICKIVGTRFVASTLLIDIPIPIHSNLFKMKINLKINTTQWLQNGHNFIGIVPDTFNAFNQSLLMSIWNKNVDHVYGRFGIGNESPWGIWNGLEFNRTNFETKYGDYGQQSLTEMYNAIFCMEYDGESKELKLTNFETKTLIHNFKIECSETPKYYYPAVSLRDKNDSVQIV